MSASGLVLEGVGVSRGGGPVISGVDLRVEPGTVTALVGPNGAGKTSLLEAVSGVVPASSGVITMDGATLSGVSRVHRARRGLLHIEQGRPVFGALTVLENLRLGAVDVAAVDDALQRFPELVKRKDSPTALLSGGEQQMVVLARAFAAKPRYLLIDEMSLGLAPVVFLRLLPLVVQIAAEGVGVLLVEQFTHQALGIAGSALVVSSGRVTFSGAAQLLLDAPDVLHEAYLGAGPAAAAAE